MRCFLTHCVCVYVCVTHTHAHTQTHTPVDRHLQAAGEADTRFAAQLLAACQDTDYQVRVAAAQQLPALAAALGPAATVERLLPELRELLDDDEVQVRTGQLAPGPRP